MATLLYMSATRIIAGEFDSAKRYLRSNVPGANMPITQGVTFNISYVATGATTHWRYSVAGYTVDFGGTLSSSASYTLVTT
jgi:hypothetical protein